MGKFIKWSAGIVAAVVLLVLAAIIILPLVIDPNDYKDDIVQLVHDKTGRELAVSEPLELSVFPWLGIAAGGVSLSNAAGFGDEPFARLSALNLKVKLLPLLTGKVQVDTVILKGLELHLARDAKGRTNWDDLAGEAPAKEEKGGAMAVDVQGVELVDAHVVWDDRQAKARYELKDVNLIAGALSAGSTAPLSMGFVLDMGEQGRLTFDLKGTVTVREDLMAYSMPDLAARLQGNVAALQVPIQLNLNSRLDMDLAAQSLALSGLAMTMDDTTLKGNINVGSFVGPAVQLRLDMDQIDLDRYLPAATDESEAQPVAKAAGDPLAGLRTLDLDGQINVGKLKVKNLTISDVKVTLRSKGGVLHVDPLQALLYQGRLDAKAQLDARRRTPGLAVSNKLTGVEAGPLLKDLLGEERLTGKADVQSDLRMAGLTEQEIRRSLNGTARFTFLDGALKGVNIAQLIRQAQAKLQGGTVSEAPQQTDFSELSGSAVIRNGVVDNQDLQAKSPLLRVEGKGQVDLPADTINYLLTTELVKSLEGQGGAGRDELAGLAIPVRIKGKLADPSYSVDLQSVLGSKLKQEAQEKLESTIEEKAGDKVKGLIKGFGF